MKYYEKIYDQKLKFENLRKIKEIAPMKKLKKELVFKNVNKKTGIILEVGCGLGEYLDLFSEKNFKLIGCDISIKALQMAKVYCGKANYFQADCEKLPVKDDSVDVLLLPDILEHIENDETILNEASRVCKKNSLLILITHFSGKYEIRIYEKPVRKTDVLGEGGDLRGYGWNLLDRLKSKGFRKKKVGFLFGPLTLLFYRLNENILRKSKIKRGEILSGEIVKRKSPFLLTMYSKILYMVYKLDYLLFRRGRIFFIVCEKE